MTDFRLLVFKIAEKLTSSDRQSLHYIYDIPEKDRESGLASLDILKTLNRKGYFSNAQELAEILKNAHREDLVREVESYGLNTTYSRGCERERKSPAQLRGMCDANVAQVNSIATELRRVKDSLSNNGLAQESLDRLCHELSEVEQVLQGLLGRCEIMHRCCIPNAADETLRSSPNKRQQEQKKQQQQLQRNTQQVTDEDRALALKSPPIPRRKKTWNRSHSEDKPSSATSLPLSPTVDCRPNSATHVHSAPATPNTWPLSPDYGLLNSLLHAVNHCGMVQSSQSPQSSRTICHTTNAVWKHYRSFKQHRHKPTAHSASSTEVVTARRCKVERPQVPKKPDWLPRKKLVVSSKQLENASSHNKPLGKSTSSPEDSGYSTGAGSMGNLLSVCGSDSQNSSTKDVPRQPRKPRQDDERLHHSLKKPDEYM